MATNRKEYEFLINLKAALGDNFNQSFKSAISTTNSLKTSIQAVQKVQRDITSYQKQRTAVENNRKKLAELTEEHDKLAAEMKATATPSENLRQKLEKNEKQIAETTAKIEEEEKSLSSLSEELDKAGINTADLTTEQEKLGKEYDKLKEKQKSYAELNTAIAENKQRVSELKTELTKATAVAAGAATAFYAAFITPSANLEEQMSTVEALSGATDTEMKELTALAKEMGATTQFTAVEAGQALEYMAMAGWEADDMTAGLSGVMNLAAASGEDLATVSDIVTDALTALGYTADDTGMFVDVLAAAATSSNTTVSGLGEAFQYVASTAGTLGYSAQDLAVALGTMANSGVKGSQAGNALKTALSRMAAPTSAVQSAMDSLGISMTDDAGNVKSLMEVMQNLRSSIGAVDVELVDADGNLKEYDDIISELSSTTEGLSKVQQIEAASTIFGKNAMAGMLTIVNASDEDFQSLSESIYGSAGAAEEMSKIRLDNLNGDITLAKSAWDGLATTIGDLFNGSLRGTVQSITEIIGKVNEWVQANPEVTATIIKIVGALLALKVGTTAAKLGFNLLKGDILKVTKLLFDAEEAGGLAGLAMQKWTTISQNASKVTKALGTVFGGLSIQTVLIVAGIAAIIAVIVLVVKHWDKVKEVALSVWEAIKSAWGAAAEWFGALWEKIKAPFVAAAEWFNTTVVQPIITIFGPIVEKIGEIFSTLWQIVTALFSVAASWFNDNVIQPVISVFSGIVESVGGFFSALWQRITEIFSAVASWFGERFAEAWAAIKAVFAPVAAFFAGIWQTIKEQFSKIGTAIGDAIGNAFKSVVNAILTFAENKINGFINAINTVVGVVNKIPGVSISTITPLSIPKLATGSANTPETFIAGEAGAELITNAKNRTVYTAAQTGQLMEASATMISILPLLQAAIEAAKVRQSVPTVGGRPEESDTPTVTAAGEKQTSVVINSAPVFHVGSDAQAQDIEELLRKHDEALLDEVEERQRQREDDERRRNYD